VTLIPVAPAWDTPVVLASRPPAIVPFLPPHVCLIFPATPPPLRKCPPGSFMSAQPAPSWRVVCFFSFPSAPPIRPLCLFTLPRLPCRLPWRLRGNAVSTPIGIDSEDLVFPKCRCCTGLSDACDWDNACHVVSRSVHLRALQPSPTVKCIQRGVLPGLQTRQVAFSQ